MTMTKNTICVVPENITPDMCFRDLVALFDGMEKWARCPSTRKLTQNVGEPIISHQGCELFSNGYASYDNGSGRTVIWLPECTQFTYCFDFLTALEREYMPQKSVLNEEELGAMPWFLVVALIGEHRIEANIANRTSSRKGTRDYDFDDKDDKTDKAEKAIEKSYAEEFCWREDYAGESPESIFIRKEERAEMLSRMTEAQRVAFNLYYYMGYTQVEIANKLKIDRSSVRQRLDGALQKIKR